MPSRQLCSVISDLQQSQLWVVDHVGIRHTVVSHQRICGVRAVTLKYAADFNAVYGKQKWPKHAWQLNTT